MSEGELEIIRLIMNFHETHNNMTHNQNQQMAQLYDKMDDAKRNIDLNTQLLLVPLLARAVDSAHT